MSEKKPKVMSVKIDSQKKPLLRAAFKVTPGDTDISTYVFGGEAGHVLAQLLLLYTLHSIFEPGSYQERIKMIILEMDPSAELVSGQKEVLESADAARWLHWPDEDIPF